MSTASSASLLHVALEDLHAGKVDQAKRLPIVAGAASDAALRRLLESEAEQAAAQAARITDAGVVPGTQPNIWMAGILDDAERDTRQIQPGRLLDIALIGAIRKAKAAEIVSSETAVALAEETGVADLAALVRANRDEEVAADRALKARLVALTGG
jgi:ferritin-like metal-binding protein YciE